MPTISPQPLVTTIPSVITEAFAQANKFGLEPWLVMMCHVGSTSHNTYVPKTEADGIDDIDWFGVVCPPPERSALAVSPFEHWTFMQDEHDVTIYSLDKFVRLLMKANPNVLGTLWLRPEHVLYSDPGIGRFRGAWQCLMQNRDLFATKAAFASFAGYASGQLHRMTAYTPEIDTEIASLTEQLSMVGWKLQDIMDKRSLPMPIGIDPDLANAKADRLRALRARYHLAYAGEKRRGLVRKHGYDTKMAAHLVRLLRMCIEFLQAGEMQVFRTFDADELRAIKRGEWSLEAVKAEAERLFAKAKEAKESSLLPDEAPVGIVSQLLVRLHAMFYGWESHLKVDVVHDVHGFRRYVKE